MIHVHIPLQYTFICHHMRTDSCQCMCADPYIRHMIYRSGCARNLPRYCHRCPVSSRRTLDIDPYNTCILTTPERVRPELCVIKFTPWQFNKPNKGLSGPVLSEATSQPSSQKTDGLLRGILRAGLLKVGTPHFIDQFTINFGLVLYDDNFVVIISRNTHTFFVLRQLCVCRLDSIYNGYEIITVLVLHALQSALAAPYQHVRHMACLINLHTTLPSHISVKSANSTIK